MHTSHGTTRPTGSTWTRALPTRRATSVMLPYKDLGIYTKPLKHGGKPKRATAFATAVHTLKSRRLRGISTSSRWSKRNFEIELRIQSLLGNRTNLVSITSLRIILVHVRFVGLAEWQFQLQHTVRTFCLALSSLSCLALSCPRLGAFHRHVSFLPRQLPC